MTDSRTKITYGDRVFEVEGEKAVTNFINKVDRMLGSNPSSNWLWLEHVEGTTVLLITGAVPLTVDPPRAATPTQADLDENERIIDELGYRSN